MVDFVGLGILLLLVLLFGYLAVRAWGSHRNRVLKWVGLVLSALLALIFALVFVVAIMGTLKLNANYDSSNPVREFNAASATPDQLAFGAKYAHLCAGCHSPNQQTPLVGNNFGAEIGFPIGTLYAPNLTPAGEVKDWSDGEIVRAIREGVHKSGRALIIMPAEEFHSMSDEDVTGIVAYLRSQPPTPPDTPRNSLNVIGAVLVNAFPALTNQPHISQPMPKPAVAPSAEYGEYVVGIAGCRSCHGQDLHGSTGGFAGPAPSLQLVKGWSAADLTKVLRTGVTPDGKQLSDNMPWKEFNEFLTDTDIQAVYEYLKTVP